MIMALRVALAKFSPLPSGRPARSPRLGAWLEAEFAIWLLVLDIVADSAGAVPTPFPDPVVLGPTGIATY